MASRQTIEQIMVCIEAERLRQNTDDPNGPVWTWLTSMLAWASTASDKTLRELGWKGTCDAD
jgi:hypothetical protein